MVQQSAARAQIFLALRHDVIHLGDLGSDLGLHLLDGHASGTGDRRGFPTGGEVTESHDNDCPTALRPGLGRGQRLSSFGHALKSLDGPGVG